MRAAAGYNNRDGLQDIYPSEHSGVKNEREQLAAHGIDGDGDTFILLDFGSMKAARFKEQMTPLNLYKWAASRVTIEVEGKLYNGQAVRDDFPRDADVYPFVKVLVRNLTPI